VAASILDGVVSNLERSPDVPPGFCYGGEFSERIIRRPEGARVYGSEGREVLDYTSAQMSSILGHSHPEIVASVHDATSLLNPGIWDIF
jgi:4-aminobutyrate aminotransferase-like enzyme